MHIQYLSCLQVYSLCFKFPYEIPFNILINRFALSSNKKKFAPLKVVDNEK